MISIISPVRNRETKSRFGFRSKADRVTVGGKRRDGYCAVFEFIGPRRVPLKSQLVIFSDGDWFLKFRITYPRTHSGRVDEEVEKFLANFAWPDG
jgi:hypothetical protein